MNVKLIYRPIERWPVRLTVERKSPPFTAPWSDTQTLLDKELGMLGVDSAVLQMALTESDFRLDGAVRANAKLQHPGVILAFEHPRHGPLSYPCDTFDGGNRWVSARQRGGERGGYRNIEGWQINTRAIALGLEALRKVDRYGITPNGEQYRGFQAIGTGKPQTETMTRDEAALFIAAHAWPNEDPVLGAGHILRYSDDAKAGYRLATKALHPDAGAYDDEAFKRLQLAWRTLGGGS